jgi:hypothetical protein
LINGQRWTTRHALAFHEPEQVIHRIFFVSPAQVNDLIPAGTAEGITTVTIFSGPARPVRG